MKTKKLLAATITGIVLLFNFRTQAQCINCTDSSALNNGLVFCLPFNGNANDETGNGYNGTVNGAALTSDRFGNANKAYSFDGTNDYIDLGANLPNLTSFSFSFWIKPTGNASTNGFIFFEGDAACGNDINMYYTNGTLHFTASKGGSQMNGTSGAGLVSATILNSWTHVVWTLTSTQSLIYINGVLVQTFNKTGSGVGNHYTPTIGSIFDGGGAPCGSARSQYFQGDIDDVRLYNRVLSAAEVLQLSDSNCCASCTSSSTINNGLVFCLPFNANANDETGNGYNGTVNGAALTSDRFGNANKAYSFDGTNDYIDLATNLPNLTTFSFSFWIKPTGNVSTNGFIFFEGDAACGNDINMYYTNGTLHFTASKGGSQMNGTSGAGLVSATILNSWTHVVWTLTSTQSLIYINGVLVQTFNKTGSGVGNHYTPTIGSIFDGGGAPCGSARSQYFQGDIDDVRLYNRVLSAAEVLKLDSCSNSYFLFGKRQISTGIYQPVLPSGDQVVIFPNPVHHNAFNIHLPSEAASAVSVSIYDVSGKKVKTYDRHSIVFHKDEGNIEIQHLDLNTGIYIAYIQTGMGIFKSKFTVE